MSTVPFAVSGSGSGVSQHITAEGEHEHVFRSDADPAYGGRDEAPSPLSYALGALTSCNQVTAQLVATDLGITLGEFCFMVRGDLDTSVFMGGEAGRAGFEAVRVDVSVESDAEGEDFDHFVSELERRCPLTQLFRNGGFVYESTWHPLPLAP